MLRLFIAVPLPAEIRAACALLQTRMPGARWVKADNLHLTLRFVGEADGATYEALRETLGEARGRPFELALGGLGHFPPRGAPRVLWAGVERSEPLAALQRRAERAVQAAGVPPEGRGYSAHLTLARLERTPARAVGEYLAANNLFKAGPFRVESFALLSSKLRPDGPVYTVEQEYPLTEETPDETSP